MIVFAAASCAACASSMHARTTNPSVLVDQAGKLAAARRLEDAATLYQRAIDDYRRSGRAETAEAAAALQGLGSVRLRQHRMSDAERAYHRALVIRERLHETVPGDLSDTLLGLADALYEEQRLDEASNVIDRACRLSEEAHHHTSPRVAECLARLGWVERTRGNARRAEALYREAVAIDQKAGGDEEALVDHLGGLGVTLGDLGKLEEAETILEDVLDREQRREHDGLDASMAMLQLGLDYRDDGQLARAEKILTRALAIKRRLSRDHDPSLLPTLAALAGTYVLEGDYERAEPLYQDAIAIAEHLDAADPRAAVPLADLGRLRQLEGRLDEAERYLGRARTLLANAYGPDHLEIARTDWKLGVVYIADGRLAAAETAIRDEETDNIGATAATRGR